VYCWGSTFVVGAAECPDPLFTGEGAVRCGAEVPYRVPGSEAFRSIAVGETHVCAIDQDGALHCWGNASDDAPAIGRTIGAVEPVRVGSDADWVEVCAGYGHTCATRADGQLYCFGSNDSGQLGLGADIEWTVEPTPVGAFEHPVCGRRVTCAERAGELFCWGHPERTGTGQAESDVYSPTPVDVPPLVALASHRHSCGITGAGALYCWGTNADHGQAIGVVRPGEQFVLTPTVVCH
jgi:alpha-tubulin suppressor-like RCC1 family protein